MIILIPGRHHLLTTFQHHYLLNVIATEKVDAIIFAVTSANHSNTRRNPLPFYLRALAIEEFGKALGVPCFIYGIDDVGTVKNFSTYTIKRIHHESEGQFDLQPSNTLVVCSTPVLEMYEQEGFRILTAELEDRKTWKHHSIMPWDLVEKIAATPGWLNDKLITKEMHPASIDVWKRYRCSEKVQMLFRDKMISDDGDITTTRDYNTYVRQMDEIALLKYEDTAPFIRGGRIGDIGCAVGSWIKLACNDSRWRESDFYGIEVARHLFDICQQRKHNGEFNNPFVFFSQRNAVTGLAFDKGSMNTIHTSSLTHEIESYGSRAELLSFIKNRFDELAPGGVWVNRDVVGPEDRDRTVFMKLAMNDGRNDGGDLKSLSTYRRFLKFAKDFRAKEGYRLQYEIVDDRIRLSLKDACEFMSRKDYVDNWESEMHETFCFWDFNDWRDHLTQAGFTIVEGSKAYTNQWIVNNRLKGKVELFTEDDQLMDYPVTNMIMVAEKK